MTAIRPVRRMISGWGRYPVEDCLVYRPDRRHELESIVTAAPEASLVARGLGRSYGDAALNGDGAVVSSVRMNRLVDFDAESGVLHCEAAVTLAEIIDVFLPKGFFFPVTPGTKTISIGGAIAADVHGKNHHCDGTLSQHLLEFHLMTASGDVLRCARDENPDIFWATIGGMGLTGIVLDARIRLKPVETAYLRTRTEQTRDLDDTLSRMTETDAQFSYSVAWVDCLASGSSLGRSILLRANPASREALPEALRARPFAYRSRPRPAVPFDFPSLALNRVSMKLFNTAFYHSHRDGERLDDADHFFYPLDAIPNWNRIYGKRGVLQYQALLPTASAASGLSELLELISREAGGSFLAVLKSMGAANDAPLSFPHPGMTLSLDFPYTGPNLIAHLNRLDDLVVRSGGRVYLAKDSCLRPEHVRAMYPRLDEFLEVKSRIDPDRRFDSSLARRLGLWASR